MAAAFAVAPHVGIYPVFLMKALCFALFACAFNLLIGFGGLLSFGHAMFLGTAGYVSAHAAKVWGAPPELAILAGTAAAALLGVVVGALAIRRQGIYFAMITLALAQMIFFFCLQAPFTGGEDGIQAVPRGKLFGLLDLSGTLTMYYVVLAIFLFGYFAAQPDPTLRWMYWWGLFITAFDVLLALALTRNTVLADAKKEEGRLARKMLRRRASSSRP
jgi:branched-chain amino acid transport system permease protein